MVAQPMFSSVTSTARYLMGCFCTDRAPGQPGKSPLPPAPGKSLEKCLGDQDVTPGLVLRIPSAVLTHITHLSLWRDHMGKELCVYTEGWEEIKLEPGQRCCKASCLHAPFLGSADRDLPRVALTHSSTCISPLQESKPYPLGTRSTSSVPR